MVTENPGGFWLQESLASSVIGPNIFSTIYTKDMRTIMSGCICNQRKRISLSGLIYRSRAFPGQHKQKQKQKVTTKTTQ